MMNKNLTKKKKKGFTLIELIVVIAIIGILAAVGIPKFSGMQDVSKVKADAATAQSIIKAARVQEAATNTALTELKDLDSKYMVAPAPTSDKDGTFTLGSVSGKYVVKWTPDSGDYAVEQTVTEGVNFEPKTK